MDNDLSLYGNSFTVDGERVHPSEVTIFVPNKDLTQLTEAREHLEQEICNAFSPRITITRVAVPDDTYEIPQHVIDSLNRFIEKMLLQTMCPPTPEPPPVTPGCGCQPFSIVHLCGNLT